MPKNAASLSEAELTLRRPAPEAGGAAEEAVPLVFLGSDSYGHWFGRLGEIREVFLFGSESWWAHWTLGGPRPRLGRVPRASRSTCHIAPPARVHLAQDGTPDAVQANDLGIRIVSEPDADTWVEGEARLNEDFEGLDAQALRLSKHRQFAVVAAFEEPFRYHYLRWGALLPEG